MPFDHDILKLNDRLRMLLEELPRLDAVKHLERAWRRRATQYIAHNDVTAFEGLLTEVDRLARALGVGRNGKINTGLAAATLPAPMRRDAGAAEAASRHRKAPSTDTEAGPGLPGWGRSGARNKRVMYSGPRAAPPLQYPWGAEPPVSPPRRSDPCTVARDSGSPWRDPYLARLRAEADGESEALRRNGAVQYHGPDEPPTYAMRDTA